MSDISLKYMLFGEDKTASKAIKGVGHEATSTATKIGGAFGKLGGMIGGEFGDILDRVGGGLDKLGEHGKNMGAKIAVGGAAVAGLGAALQLAGSADKQAHDQLNAAIEASGHSAADYKEEIEKSIASQENFGHSASDTQQALMKLTASTGDPKKALEQMGVVADLAAARHISLSDASTMVSKILAGSGAKTLTQYGITMDKSKDKTEASKEALEQLAKKLSGQASASVDNFGGKVDIIKTKLGDWTAQIGQKVGPALTVLGPVLLGVGSIIEAGGLKLVANSAKWVFNTAAMVANQVAGIAVKAATLGWAAAQWLLNAALTANPIGLIIAGIVLLVGALILAYKHSAVFRAIVTAAFGAVLAAGKAVWGWIKQTWALIGPILLAPFKLEFGAIKLLWGGLTKIISGIKDAIGTAWGFLTGILSAPFRKAVQIIQTLMAPILAMIDKVTGFVSGISSGGATAASIAKQKAAGNLGGTPHRAAGGPTLPYATYEVNEDGTEYLTMGSQGGYITPHGAAGGTGGDLHLTLEVDKIPFAKAVVRAFNAPGGGRHTLLVNTA